MPNNQDPDYQEYQQYLEYLKSKQQAKPQPQPQQNVSLTTLAKGGEGIPSAQQVEDKTGNLAMAGGMAGSLVPVPGAATVGAGAGAALEAYLKGKPIISPDTAQKTLMQGLIPELMGPLASYISKGLGKLGDIAMQKSIGAKVVTPGLGTDLASEGLFGTKEMMKNQIANKLQGEVPVASQLTLDTARKIAERPESISSITDLAHTILPSSMVESSIGQAATKGGQALSSPTVQEALKLGVRGYGQAITPPEELQTKRQNSPGEIK